MHTLNLDTATVGPSLNLISPRNSHALSLPSGEHRSPALAIDGLKGASPTLHIISSVVFAGANDPEPTMSGGTVALVASVAGVLVLAGGGWVYWEHLKTQARDLIDAAALTLDEEGLRMAVAQGHGELIPAYRRLGVTLADANDVIEAAVVAGDPALLESVIAGGARWEHESHAAQMLGYVISQGQPQMLAALLKAGAKPEDPAFGGPLILSRLAAESGQWSVLSWIIENRPKETFVTEDGGDLGSLIAVSDVPDLVTLAQDRWSYDFKSAVNRNGDTPLHLAAANKSSALVAKLLAIGCDPMAVNTRGMTPLQSAIAVADDASLTAFVSAKNPKVTEALLGTVGALSLINAGMAETVAALIKVGAVEPDMLLDNHVTLLGQASVKGQEAVVTALLLAKADPNLSFAYGNTEGVTPLMLAALGGFESIAEALIAHGAAKDAVAQNGFTVKMAAERGGNAQIIDMVEE